MPKKKNNQIKRANGTGTIIDFGSRSHLRYGARVTTGWIEGKQAYKWLGRWKTRTEAQTYLDLYNTGQYTPIPDITFSQLYEEWKDTHFNHIPKKLQGNYKNAFTHFANIHSVKFADLRTGHYQSIIDKLDRSRSTKQKMKVLLTLMYKYAMQNDICNKDYGTFVKIEKAEKVEKEIFTDAEIQVLWKNVNTPYVDTILILIYTGMRIQEMLNLTKFNINIKDMVITGGVKTDSGKNRPIPIHPRIYDFIVQYYYNATDVIFTRGDNTAISQDYYRKYIYYPILKQLNINHKTPHSTRHTFASLLARAGAETIDIKNLIGHSDYAFTANVYTHSDIQGLRQAINRL